MSITDAVAMLGAIAVFLFGMSTMTNGLETLSSGRLEHLLEKLTNSVFKGVCLGALVTAVIHSSATTTVMCVGFVNAGIMKLEQTVGIIMGANIGTTVTAQILRLSGISGDGNLILTLLQPSVLGPVMAVIGIFFYMFLKGGKKKNIGQILMGMGLLFIGMSTMTQAVAPLQNEPWLQELFTAFSNPILGMAVGAAITAVLQSSTAFTGILQALSTTGAIRFNTAIPLIMGQNIGTCLTAVLSSAGASKNAKRTAFIHLFFNVFGSVFFLLLLYIGNAVFHFPFWTGVMDMGSVANFHLIFNLTCTALLLPFNQALVRLAKKLVPQGPDEFEESSVLDERFLSSPSLALERAREATLQMGQFARENYAIAVGLLSHFDPKKLERLNETERSIDKLEGLLNNYLVKLTDRALSQTESTAVSDLLHTVSDYERIGDYVVNVSEAATALHDLGTSFSDTAQQEVDAITGAVGEALDKALDSYSQCSRALAEQVEPLEEVVDLLQAELKNRHIERLKAGSCTVELGTQFLELLINLERISDHCSSIAIHIIQETSKAGELIHTDTHAYLHNLHMGGDKDFDALFSAYRAKYFDPVADLN